MNNMLIFVLLLLIFRYMVDAADREKVEASRNELHNLLDKPQLQGIPVGVPPTAVFIYVVDTETCKCGDMRLLCESLDLNCYVILGFGTWQQKGSPHCFR